MSGAEPVCPACGLPIAGHDASERKRCHDACSGYRRPGAGLQAPEWAFHGGGETLRRHLRDAHHFDADHLDIAPDEGLAWEHVYDHEDGLDMEEHTHV